jgi:hypothetical protein
LNLLRHVVLQIRYLRSNAQATDKPPHGKHGILSCGRLYDATGREDDDGHNDRVLPRQLIGKVTREESTDQSAKLQHGSHQALPKACAGCIIRYSGEFSEELIHNEGH